MDELKYEYILVRFGELSTKGKNKHAESTAGLSAAAL